MAGQPQLPLLPSRARAAPELQGAAGNVIQELPGSGKIWVLVGAKNTVWQPLPPSSGTPLLPFYAHPGGRQANSLHPPPPSLALGPEAPQPLC